MNTREQFGSYILLKKVGDDALGETFRAGRFGAQGIEQVVLLRVFNGQGLDGRALWQKVAARQELHGVLRSPNLASGVDFGELQGVPYAAYDYISGKNLASLMDQASQQRSALPTDHALLITERIALGLTAALETRLAGKRLLHGFVVPDLVMISNEGEAKLLGFEVAPGLREMAASNAAVRGFERYLSPEALAGEPAHKSDDVYSLGVILYELLTARALPAQIPSVDALLAQAQAANENEPIPERIRQLLQRSLAPREQRVGDAASWHKALSQMMIEGQYNPTTFNLAFFMHSLFRDEIEKESRELKSEQNLEPPTSTAEMSALATGALATTASADTMMVSSSDFTPEDDEAKGSKKGLFAALAAVLLLAVAGTAFFYWNKDKEPTPTTQTEQVATPVVQEPEVPAGPTQEEIQAELDQMRTEMTESLSAQSEEMQAELEKRYEARLAKLQQQYDEAQREDQARDEAAAQLAAAQSEPPAAIVDEPAEEDAATAAAAAQTAANAATPGTTVATTQIAETRTAEAQPSKTQPAKPQPAKPQPQQPAVRTAEPPPPASAQPAAPPPPAEPTVRRGDLVEPGPGVVPPRLLEQAPASYTAAARRFRREATIVVRALVDENGEVTKTELMSKKAGLGLDEAALQAARRSTFRPATKGGVPVKMWHSLRFDFKP